MVHPLGVGQVPPAPEQADLEPVIALAMRRFEQFEALRREAADFRQALEDRKVIERAKGRLMEQFGLTEDQAYTRMRRAAMDRQLPLAEIAQRVLDAQPDTPSAP